MADLMHYIGGDLILGNAGDLGIADGSEETRERVLRRLITNPGAYLFHLGYGAGLELFIGKPLNAGTVAGATRSQMLLETGVAQVPPPNVTVQGGFNTVAVDLQYVDAVTGLPVQFGFDVTGGP